ncbi:MAG: SH3 domain-containing protein [Bacilli bacterium]|nr:SH3 domain-containing protein [Bacilli bacterium]
MSKLKNLSNRVTSLLVGGCILLSGCSVFSENSKTNNNQISNSSTSESSLISESNPNNIKGESSEESKEESSEESKEESSEESKEESSEESKEESSEESKEENSEESKEESSEESKEESSEEGKEESSEEDEEENSKEGKEESSKEDKEESDNQPIEEDQQSYKKVYTKDNNSYVIADETVNVRPEPNTNCEPIDLLYENSKVKLLGKVEGEDWYIVDLNGKEAYVTSLYTHVVDETKTQNDSKTFDVGYFPDGSTLYSDKDLTKPIRKLPKLDSAFVYGKHGDKYYVEVDGQRGYVSASSLVFLSKPIVIIDKSSQTGTLVYDEHNETIAHTFPVITGSECPDCNTPTDEGLHYIYNVTTGGCDLVGPTWNSHVSVFIRFTAQHQGLHDAWWQPEYNFKTNTKVDKYIQDYEFKNYVTEQDISQIPYDEVPAFLRCCGSHGCVNCPYKDVCKIAEIVCPGDKVLVHR